MSALIYDVFNFSYQRFASGVLLPFCYKNPVSNSHCRLMGQFFKFLLELVVRDRFCAIAVICTASGRCQWPLPMAAAALPTIETPQIATKFRGAET